MKLEQRFDPKWFLPEGTHLSEYIKARDTHFPHVGWDAGFYMGALNYTHELKKIKAAVDQLENMTDITSNIMSWVDPFRTFVLTIFKHGKMHICCYYMDELFDAIIPDVYEEVLDEDRFSIMMSKFLHSPRYAKYQGNFVFERDLECGAAIPKIKVEFNV